MRIARRLEGTRIAATREREVVQIQLGHDLPTGIQDARDQAEEAIHAAVDGLDPVAPLGVEKTRRSHQEQLSGGADGRERIA